jgi:tetratricopeptide (TPR) repeat protein
MSEEHEEEHRDTKQGIEGVFSNQEVRRVGTGTTTRKTIQKSYWYAVEQEDGSIEMQPLNLNYIPSGPKKRVSKDDFLETFAPEPEFYVTNVFPKIREVNKTIARADRYRKNKEFFSAEMEYGNALRVDEDNIRANFGLGITYLERGENKKAEDILGRLVKLEGAFEDEHKHLFNDFGINLRKNGLFDQSIAYYERALELTTHDENLYYNVARAYLEKKDPGKALEYLLKGLDLNPRQETLLKFLMWMITKNLVGPEQRSAVAAMLRRAKEAPSAEKKPDADDAAKAASPGPASEASAAAPGATGAAGAAPVAGGERAG